MPDSFSDEQEGGDCGESYDRHDYYCTDRHDYRANTAFYFRNGIRYNIRGESV